MRKAIFFIILASLFNLYAVDNTKMTFPICKAVEALGEKIQDSDLTFPEMIAILTEGISDPYFSNVFIEHLKTVIKEHPNGEYKEYWPNGQLKFKAFFKNGMPEGHFHAYYENRAEAFKGYIKNGKRIGVHISFFPEEKSWRDFSCKILSFNEKGFLHGQQSVMWNLTQIKAILEYNNGLLNQNALFWNQKGTQIERLTFKNGNQIKTKTSHHTNESSPYIKYVHELKNAFKEEMRKKYGLICIGSGGGMPYDIVDIDFDFQSLEKPTSIEKARQLIVAAIERFQEMINSHEKIQPYLREVPFTIPRVYITLNFTQEKGKPLPTDKVVSVNPIEKDLVYFYEVERKSILMGKEHICYDDKEFYRESYKEAVTIARKGNSK